MRQSIVAAQLALVLFLCTACRDRTAGPVKPRKGEQVCFECGGKRHLTCVARGCQKGHIECPSPCLKLSQGQWERLDVVGHAPDELWQKFPKAGGGYEAWNHHHVGEVIQTEGGNPRNIGKCQTCKGTSRVPCRTCLGKGAQACFVCEGKAVVPAAWTSANNPRINNHPDLIRLRDGRAFVGRIAMQAGSFSTIRTRDGRLIDVSTGDILAKPALP